MYLSEKSFQGGTYISPRKMEEEDNIFNERLRKTFYYGKLPGTERPSLPVTDLLVDFYNDAAPRELGKLDNYLAASTSRSACISPSSVMAGMVYVKRLKKKQPEYLTQVSSSELFLISMMMASKFLYDEGVDEEVFNDEWANSGDVETEDVNQLELDFLAAIDWQLFVRPEEFSDMLHKIERRVALKQGRERGWFSYTDLMVLSQDLKFMNWNDLVSELSTVFSATSLAYLAGILTMVGSTMLGTATSLTLMNTGSTVLPLCIRALPALTLYPELSLEPRNPGSLVELSRSEVIGVNSTELNDISKGHLESLQELNESNPGYLGDRDTVVENESGNDLDSKTDTRSQHKEQNGLLNGFLPPFLALVTLKDTLLNFAYGARLSYEPNKDSDQGKVEARDSTKAPEETKEFCSSGPCLVDSWPNCWNVSMETDWFTKGTWTEHSCLGEASCCSHCTRNMKMKDRPGLDTNLLKGAEIIHCCCRQGNTGNSWLKGSLHTGMLDINLRFATQSIYPVFVTT
ncbi:protein CNPPD1-like [Mercenaria mercenaria]|uniref:protein CNPPD1-like n=1 Tax=Mercenaria mercenaria TaxID=6596 RepID=UPI00234F6851|nr:protein CNPPD1-like [Mercenaria mercenaria]